MKRTLRIKAEIFIASCSNAVLYAWTKVSPLFWSFLFGPKNISLLESHNKSPQFRLIKRTSRAIYNLQSPPFCSLCLHIHMNDVSIGFSICCDETTFRINKLKVLRAFCAYEMRPLFPPKLHILNKNMSKSNTNWQQII